MAAQQKAGPLRAVIFDMDGVLIDSEPVYLEYQYQALSRRYPWVSRESLYPTVGMSGQEHPLFMATLCRRTPDAAFRAELDAIFDGVQVDYRTILRPEVPQVLADLRAQGLRLALASSSGMANIRRVLAECGLRDAFDCVVSGEQFTRSKPDPEIYRTVMRRLGCRPQECLIVEDSTYGIAAGAASGGIVAALRDDRFPFDQAAAQLHIAALRELPALAACGGRRIRAAFFDVDGTLAEVGSHRIPAGTYTALARLREQGIAVLVSTGRHPLEIEQEALLPGITLDGGVYMNGQLCVVRGRPVLESCIPAAALRGLKEYLARHGRSCIFLEQDRMYANFVDARMAAEQAKIGTAPPPAADIDGLEGRKIYQVIPFIAPDEEAALLGAMPGCKLLRWGENVVDITGADGGKERGMLAVCAALGIDPAQTIAFGDAENDLGILWQAGIGVAMGNALATVKRSADYVTARVEADGVYRALKHFYLI